MLKKITDRRRIIFLMVSVFFSMCAFLAAGCRDKNLAADAPTGFTVIDEQGTEIKFTTVPRRVLTLAMSSDGIVMGLGEQKKLIAVSALADDPVSSNIVKQAQQIEHKIRNPSQEEVLALQPDLVLAYDWHNPEIIENVRALGINVVVLKTPETITDIKRNVRTIAAALQVPHRGELLVAAMDKHLQQIREKIVRQKTRRKIVLLSLMNSYGGLGCIFDDMCREAGVVNGLSAAGLRNGQELTKEMLVQIDPDVLIMPVYNDHGTFDIKKYNREFLEDPALQVLRAIKNKQLFYPRDGFIYNCSQDVVFGVQEIARAAYGEEFALPSDSHLKIGNSDKEEVAF